MTLQQNKATGSGVNSAELPLASSHRAANSNTNYCYRHHPDVSCFRQTDASMMESLQKSMDQLEKLEDREAISRVWSLFSTASSSQRMLMLKGLLTQCCFPQLSEVSSIVQDLIKIDFISALPIELSFKILCYLDSASLCRAAQVCHRWKNLADDDIVWHSMCEQHIDRKCTKCGWGLPLLEKKRLREWKKNRETKPDSTVSTPPSPEGTQVVGEKRSATADSELENSSVVKRQRRTRPWKEVYAERYKVESNWRHGRYRLKEFKDTNSVLSLQFDEQHLMTGTYDGNVKVWDVETGEIIRVLDGHVRAVSCLKFDDSKLVTGSWDSSVRIWNYRTGECVCTFRGHEAKVLCLDCDGNLIASGAADNNIKIWNFDTQSCFTLRGHREWVNCVKLHTASKTLYSASEDVTVRMWDLNTKQCIKVFGGPDYQLGGHIAQIQCVIPLTLDHLEGQDENCAEASEEEGGTLKIEDGSDGSRVVRRSRGSFSVVSNERRCAMDKILPPISERISEQDAVQTKARPTHILTASLDNTIRLWDISTGACVRTLFGHVEGVWTIAADTFRIVSGGHDKLVKVWDLQSGRCWHTFSGHTKPVCAVGLSDTRFASGGDDGVVQMYCFDDF